MTALSGKVETPLSVCCAVARGSMNHDMFVLPSAAGDRRTPATTSSVFGSPRTYSPFSFVLLHFFYFNLWRCFGNDA